MKASSLAVLLDRPIAFHRPFVDLTGSINSALMLSQALYWSQRTTDQDGWFYKTREEWQSETSLSRTEQENARRLLRNTGFWQEELRGVPAKIYYRIDFNKLATHLEGNLPTSRTSNQPTGTTTETTTSSAGVPPAAPTLELVSDGPTLNQRTWTAYEGAYRRRYRVAPVRNAKVNSQIAELGKRLGDEAPAVAEFYLYHNGSFYVRAKHTMNLLLRDCEGIRTEWATGKIVTQGEAQQMDRKQGNYNAVQEVIARRAARGQL